ncbi:MAG: Ig-like domain-containing protein [Ruminococcus sp.]
MRKFRAIISLLLISVILSSFSGCIVKLPDPKEMSSADEALAMGFTAGNYVETVSVGEYSFFTVNIKFDYEYDVKWSSSDTKIATVDSNGRVDGIAPGKATITAKAKTAEINYDITVTKAKNKSLSNTTAIVANGSVAERNMSSDSNAKLYAILVNSHSGCATVYTYNASGVYNVPVRAMVCSVGKGSKTVADSYNIGSKYSWSYEDGKNYHYCTEFGEYKFCSTPYSEQSADTLLTDEYNKLGKAVTSGDVWLSSADAQWIYDNCDAGTTVKVTDSSSYNALGVPNAMKLGDNAKYKNWDPTDSSKDNPYSKLKPTFTGLEELNIPLGGVFNSYRDVAAYDTCGNKSTEGIIVESAVRCDIEGRYIASYFFTDDMGRTTRQDRVVIVSE